MMPPECRVANVYVQGRMRCVGRQSANITSIRRSRAERVNSELGIVPVNELTDSSTSASWLKLPSAAGMVPLMLLPADQAGQLAVRKQPCMNRSKALKAPSKCSRPVVRTPAHCPVSIGAPVQASLQRNLRKDSFSAAKALPDQHCRSIAAGKTAHRVDQ